MPHRLLVSLVLSIASCAWATSPTRMLEIPIRGTIGADVTIEGLEQALQLAESGSWDGVIVLIDSLGGDPQCGRELARRLGACDVPKIAVVREAGGAALPVLFACDHWVVIERILVASTGPRGEPRSEEFGADRVVLRTLPPFAADAASVERDLRMLGEAMRSAIPDSIDPNVQAARRAIARVLADPGLDLLPTTPPTPVPALDATKGGGSQGPDRWRLSRQGPGLSGEQIATLDLGTLAPDGVEALAEVLGLESLETDRESGTLLMVSDADDRFDRRRRVQSLTDRMLGSLDSASSLVDAMPWSLARARLSLPTSSRLRNTFPMQIRDGVWQIADGSPRRRWGVACRESIRRWEGIREIVENVQALVERSSDARESLQALEIGSVDRDRLDAALECWSERLQELDRRTGGWDAIAAEASAAIERTTRWVETPPSVQVDS
ncbi:MAG: hypothetical protein VX672_06655 [Planctomycetota bacterium]|nr:hypothetical protein [Planctomycetota bacterium]